jgi:hypothetical protein
VGSFDLAFCGTIAYTNTKEEYSVVQRIRMWPLARLANPT